VPTRMGFGLLPGDDVDTSAGFAHWLARLAGEADRVWLPPGRVICAYRWIVEQDRVLGGIALRHELTESLLQAGHVSATGFGPPRGARGVASWALSQISSTRVSSACTACCWCALRTTSPQPARSNARAVRWGTSARPTSVQRGVTGSPSTTSMVSGDRSPCGRGFGTVEGMVVSELTDALVALRGRVGESGAAPCDQVPALVDDLMSLWQLSTTGELALAGYGGVCLPVVRTARDTRNAQGDTHLRRTGLGERSPRQLGRSPRCASPRARRPTPRKASATAE